MKALVKRLSETKRRLARLWQLSAEYDHDLSRLESIIEQVDDRLGDHTVIHADIHYRQASQIIVVGRYRSRDYVRVFDVTHKHFGELVDALRHEEKNARVGRFDMPSHAVPFSAVYDRNRF